MKNTFKAGDTIRILKSSGSPLQPGEIHIVTEVEKDGTVKVHPDLSEPSWVFDPNNVELVNNTMNNTEFKVGDKVRCIDPDDDFYGQEGIIEESDDSIYPYYVNFNGVRSWESKEDLVLVTTTNNMKKTLETVYIQCSIRELLDVVKKKFKEKGYKVDSAIRTGSKQGDYKGIFFQPNLSSGGNGLNTGTNHSEEVNARIEVSIPEFLELLESYVPEKKKVIVKLNASLTATIKVEEGQVAITGSGSYSIGFKEVEELEIALQFKSTHGFKEGDWVELIDPTVTTFLFDYAKGKGVQVHSTAYDADTYPCLSFTSHSIHTIDNTSTFNINRKNKITIEQFLEKCSATTVKLPVLAGYQVEKAVGGVKLGCQTILTQNLTQLFKAVQDAKQEYKS